MNKQKSEASSVKREGEFKSKEQILKENIGTVDGFHKLTEWHRSFLYKAMEEYAAQFSTPTPLKEVHCDAMGHYGGSHPDGICEQCGKPWKPAATPSPQSNEVIELLKRVGESGYTKHQLNDRWYDKADNYIGDTAFVLNLFTTNSDKK